MPVIQIQNTGWKAILDELMFNGMAHEIVAAAECNDGRRCAEATASAIREWLKRYRNDSESAALMSMGLCVLENHLRRDVRRGR